MKRTEIISTAALFLVVGLTVPAYAQKDDHQDQGKLAHDQQTKPEGRQQEHNQQSQQSRPVQPEHTQQAQQVKPPQQHTQQAQTSRPEQQQHTQQAQQQHTQQPQQNNRAQQQRTQEAQQTRPTQQHTQQISPVRQGQQNQQRQPQATKSVQQRNPDQVRQEQAAWQGDRAQNWKTDHRTWQQRGGYNGYRVPDNTFRAHYGQDHQFRIYSLPVVFVGGQQRFQYGGYWFGLVDPWPEYWSSDWYDNDDIYVDYYDGGYYMTDRRYPSDRVAISFYLN